MKYERIVKVQKADRRISIGVVYIIESTWQAAYVCEAMMMVVIQYGDFCQELLELA